MSHDIFIHAAEDIVAESPVKKQCRAITRRGARCNRIISFDGDVCWQHQN
jgi:hypothetical protein